MMAAALAQGLLGAWKKKKAAYMHLAFVLYAKLIFSGHVREHVRSN